MGPGWVGQLALPPELAAWLARQWDRAPVWLSSRLAMLQAAIRSIRRRVWVVATIGAFAVCAAFVLAHLPAAEVTNAFQSDGWETKAEPTAPALPPFAAGQDDPVAATIALLEVRAACLRDRSIACLDAVHASGSSSWAADAARIHEIESGGELILDPFDNRGEVSLTDLMGDTALMAVGPPATHGTDTAAASVLIIRTEAGWRFRSLIVGSTPVG
jgi:hypothetical protein